LTKLEHETQSEAFNRIWAKRRQEPIVTRSWVDNDWAKGRTQYLTFLVRVTDRQIVKVVKEAQSALTGFPCIDPLPENYFHLTVKETGCFLVEDKKASDEYTRDELPNLIRAARETLGYYKPFNVRLENLNNFKSVICIQCHDGGVIRDINRAMIEIPGMTKLRNDFPQFLPHLSIAQYKGTEGYHELIEHLEKHRETLIGTLRVGSVELVIAELPKRGRYPKLRPVEDFRLC
jgi:2'-5' RNA ligase